MGQSESGMRTGKGRVVPLILIVDDEPDIRELLADILALADYRTIQTDDGERVPGLIHTEQVDLVLLDINMPRRDGWATLKLIRDSSNVPVIILSSRGSEMERVRGLQAGANDYITKPFGRQELVARIWARLRDRPDDPGEDAVYEDAVLRLDIPSRSVMVRGQPVELSRLEFRLLASLVRHQDRVLSRDEVIMMVWGGPRRASVGSPKLYVSYLRKKFDEVEPGLGARVITTVRNFGYRYVPAT